MAESPAAVEIPNRALFKAAEVCELAKVQPYVLRSWEAEFRDLGVVRSGSTTRVYRRADVERVLRIKHLVLIEGLTLAGVRRKFDEEQEPPLELEVPVAVAPSPRVGDAVREGVGRVRRELRSLLEMLAVSGSSAERRSTAAVASNTADFALAPPASAETVMKRAKRGVASDESRVPGPPSSGDKSASPRRKRSA
jgi:DNA-binding transcriptional MerR regulator